MKAVQICLAKAVLTFSSLIPNSGVFHFYPQLWSFPLLRWILYSTIVYKKIYSVQTFYVIKPIGYFSLRFLLVVRTLKKPV